MKLFTFNYMHDYSHGGAVVLAHRYDDAVEIIDRQNKDAKYPPVIFKTMELYRSINVSWEHPILVFDKEVEIDEPKLVYEYEDAC